LEKHSSQASISEDESKLCVLLQTLQKSLCGTLFQDLHFLFVQIISLPLKNIFELSFLSQLKQEKIIMSDSTLISKSSEDCGFGGNSIVMTSSISWEGIVKFLLQLGHSISEPTRLSSAVRFCTQCGQLKSISAISKKVLKAKQNLPKHGDPNKVNRFKQDTSREKEKFNKKKQPRPPSCL
jgi:hypothetical protein